MPLRQTAESSASPCSRSYAAAVDSETTNNLITAGASLLGAVVGGTASIWATSLQFRREQKAEMERERRADARRARDLAETRARAAAVLCDSLIGRLAELVQQWDEANRPTEMTGIPMGQPLRELAAETVYLPTDLQERVQEAILILRQSDELARYHFDTEAVNWSTGVVGRESHRLIAKWLRGEGVQPRSSEWCGFVLAAERAEA